MLIFSLSFIWIKYLTLLSTVFVQRGAEVKLIWSPHFLQDNQDQKVNDEENKKLDFFFKKKVNNFEAINIYDLPSKNEELMGNLKKLRSPMGVGIPSFIQDASEWAWNDDAHVERHREHYNQKRRKMKAALTQAGFDVFGGDDGFYMWLKSSNHSTSESLSDWFLDRGLLVTPGTVFGPDGNPYIRMVFCLRDDTIDDICHKIVS